MQTTFNARFPYIALGILTLLSIPLVASQLSNEVNWELGDFLVMGSLLTVGGLLLNWVASQSASGKRKLLLVSLILALFLLTWAELAVGLFGSPLAGS